MYVHMYSTTYRLGTYGLLYVQKYGTSMLTYSTHGNQLNIQIGIVPSRYTYSTQFCMWVRNTSKYSVLQVQVLWNSTYLRVQQVRLEQGLWKFYISGIYLQLTLLSTFPDIPTPTKQSKVTSYNSLTNPFSVRPYVLVSWLPTYQLLSLSSYLQFQSSL